ncbi:MAG: hypothetical protein JXL97_06090 [Bacteroidales bacterium]|nr:hypothetical protein [Bacteroidales bacterium]
MKPLKAALPIGKWMLRLSLVLFIYYVYKDTILSFEFKNLEYITILGLSVFVLLLFIGGFLKNNSLSVISGLLIFILSTIKLVLGLPGLEAEMFMFIAIGFYFMASGNFNYIK